MVFQGDMMSREEYSELYMASVRVPLVLAIFLGLWGVVILVLQALQIDYTSVLSKASGEFEHDSALCTPLDTGMEFARYHLVPDCTTLMLTSHFLSDQMILPSFHNSIRCNVH